jgi:pimeloyl-ACP methyl ester carboxylesterase
MGIYGTGDMVVNPNQADLMAHHVRHAQVERFEDSRHFPMLDERDRFNHTLLKFLQQ